MALTKVRSDIVDHLTNATTFANSVTFSSTMTASNTAIFNSPPTVNASLVIKSSLNANGTVGNAGQVLTSNGSAAYWSNNFVTSAVYVYGTILGRG